MMPSLYGILSAGLDPAGALCVWAEVDPTSPLRPRRIVAYMTGETLPAVAVGTFIGTVVLRNGLVAHVYDRGDA